MFPPPPPPTPGGIVTTPNAPPSALSLASGTTTGQIGRQIMTPTVASVSNAQLPSTPQTTSNPSMSAASTSTIVIPIMGRLIVISTTEDAIASDGKPKANWSGLADPTAPVADPNQLRSLSVNGLTKGYSIWLCMYSMDRGRWSH